MPPAQNVPLTEKLLIGAGGWEAIKHARALRETGRVSEARWTPPVLQGLVREGDRDYRAGLKILSASNVENLCTCRQSREWGTICAHSLAVGLAIVTAQTPAVAPAAPKPGAQPLLLPFRADPAAPARLHVVLAPDLGAAWAKNQLLVGLELSAGGNQRALLAASPGAPKALLPEDYAVIEALAQIIGAVPGGMSFLSREQFGKLLVTLREHPRVTAGKSVPVRIESTSFRPPLTAKRRDDGALDLEVRLPEGSKALTGAGDAWLLRPGAARAVLQAVSPGLPAAYQALFIERTRRLPKEQAAAFLSLEWPRLEAFFELTVSGAAPIAPSVAGKDAGWQDVAAVTPGEPRFELSIEGSLQQIGARLQAIYPNKRIITVGVTPDRDLFTYPASEGKLHTRNLESEHTARSRLADLGFRGPDTTGHSFLRGEEAVLRFFSLGLPPLQKDAAWTVTLGSRFQTASRQIEVITPEIAVRGSGEDWFDLEVSFAGTSGERFPASEIQRLLQMGKGHARLRNGKLALLPGEALNDFAEVLRDCDPTQPAPGVYRMSRGQTAYLDATFQKSGWAATSTWEQVRSAGIRRPPDPELPPDLRAFLRGYQWEGVRWLHFLAANSLGGILADEMGLGKTLQALAFLASAAAGAKPSLVVCPTSLVENWRREAARFTPKLKTLAIDGPDRAPLLRQIGAVDLAITSYALLRRDLPHYRALDFSTVILDEAHQIKNPDSQIAQAACALRAGHRFVLTGTPMENSVRDLWSVMHFAMPGYLGSRDDFRERYELPLARGGEEETRNRLSRRLRPILLRRLKREVAAELPERIEQTSFCDLTPAQADVYAQLLAQSRLKLDTARREKNAGQGRMLVLTALLRLRQACCDLRLLGLDTDNTKDTVPSAKLALLDELLEEVVEGGHRVLIFSQFVSMLKILSEHLDKRQMAYCYLDGSTKPKDRTAAVERFQTDASVTAFLISVKAGGVGLNLTGADTVIHFDPWWNPAVEAQATDRAHRIGQTRVVTAYRLIARGTVEEKIFALQNRKKELTASLVEREMDEPLLETLTFAEIESLLE